MHSERCTSGSARGHAKLPVARSARRACSTQPYIPMARGWVYLVAVLDWHSRRVLAHRVSITMEADFCVEALREAATRWGAPEIVNTDQGSQFSSAEFVAEVARIGARQSMDGRGCWRDNVFVERLWRSVKYEEVYLHAYETVSQAREGIGRYLNFYNTARPHQAASFSAGNVAK